jgi:acetyltransferase-like isoleucine patch superfamily enzyme
MKKNILTKLTEDHGTRLVLILDNFKMYNFKIISDYMGKFISNYRGVKLGKGCHFFGLPHFRRYPFSTIRIGGNCTLRSDQSSNLIGINHRCIISTHHQDARIEIGDNCGFSGTSIGAAIEIKIGNNVLVGANSIITDFDWHSERSNTSPKPVRIHDNVWIGLNCTVLKGVTIGENSVIGANSLVVKDIPANVIAGGIPCKVIKPLVELV